MKHFLLRIITTIACVALGHTLAAYAGPKSPVVKVNRVILEVIAQSKTAPPIAAWKAAAINTIADNALADGDRNSYIVAGMEALFLAFPGYEGLIREKILAQVLTSHPDSKATALARSSWAELKAMYDRTTNPQRDLEKAAEYIWRPTPPAFQAPLLPHWGTEALWSVALKSALIKDLTPPQYNSLQYKEELEEALLLGERNSSTRTLEQWAIAHFWAGGAGTVTPPGMWIRVGVDLLEKQNGQIKSESKKMTALTQALSDAGCAAWFIKYTHQTWRPVTAIRNDTNLKTWEPLLATPPFPSYVSGHSTFSAAGATVIENIFSYDELLFTSDDMPGEKRVFHSARRAAEEAGMSRIYGGIHYQSDNTHGLELGRRVACATLAKHGVRNCQ
jgi:membrane-associated phospholipid phosphatase